jgi:hypothetical protein
MIIVALIVVALTFLWVRRFTRDVTLAAIATGALGLSPCFFGLEGRVFPDLATAALLLGCLLLLERAKRRSRHLLLLGVLVGISPWIHFKDALSFGPLVAIAFVQVIRGAESSGERVRQLLALISPVLVSLIGYELTIRAWYASWLPTRMVPPGNVLFALSLPRGLAAVSFDSARGLFTNNPALLLILAGLPIWVRRSPGPVLRLGLVLAPTIVSQATFSDWAGAYAPAARYALEITPALIPAIALFLANAPPLARAFACTLLGLQFLLALTLIWLRPPWGVGGEPNPLLAAIARHDGPKLAHLMPHFTNYTALVRGQWQLAAWLLGSALLLTYGARLAWRHTDATIASF